MAEKLEIGLLLHFYGGKRFLGQAMKFVDPPDEATFQALLNLLTVGARRLDRETDAIPEESEEYEFLNEALEEIYRLDREGDPYVAQAVLDRTDRIQVMQVFNWEATFGWD